MPRHHMTPDGPVDFTQAEEDVRDAQEAQDLLGKPMRSWKDSMQATDSTCPRWFEDYVTENSVALAPGKSKDSYDAKVALRGEKP